MGLLRYCVVSISLEPLFAFLASEFRLRPTQSGALALFDVFCAERAPARLPQYALLPPRELKLAAAIAWLRAQSTDAADRTTDVPARDLFDTLASGLRRDPRWAAIAATYDPARSAHENLPGARMTASQRHFVENVWTRVVRPQLVSGGFWQVSTLG